MTSSAPRSFAWLLIACVLLVSACTQRGVVTAQADRIGPPAGLIDSPAAVEEPVGDAPVVVTEEPGGDSTAEEVESPEGAGSEDPAPAADAAGTPEAVPVVTGEALIPADVCVETTGDVLSGLISWTDVAIAKSWVPSDADRYVNSLGDAGRSFLEGDLSCAITYDDGATLSVSASTNHDGDQYQGTRLPNEAASPIQILTAVEPQIARSIVEYPWAPSPTGVAAVTITFTDPDGIEAAEVRAIEQLALRIRDEAAFVPPAAQGPAYPAWYACTINQFATAQGSTSVLAAAINQPAGLHARESIDRGFGTAQCELSAGDGTATSGQPALGTVRIALAAYESGSPSFDQTVQGVLAQPGVEEGSLVVGAATYRKFAAANSVAVIIDSGGQGVISVFDTAGSQTPAELELILTAVLGELF